MSIIRWTVIAAVALLCAWLGWSSLAAGISESALDRGNFDAAVRGDSSNPHALAAAAEAALARKDIVAATRLGREAVLRAPLAVRPLRVLAQAEAAQGDHAGSENLMALAAMGGWRDKPTQAWALKRAIQSDDVPIAIARGEALIRVQGERDHVFAVFRMISLSPRGRAELIDRLATDPAWRAPFFLASGELPVPQVVAMANLLVGLKNSANPPTRAEARSTLAMLINARRMDVAWQLYVTLFGQTGRSQLPVDPGFDRDDGDYRPGASATPFEWTLFEQDQGAASIDRSDELGGNPALFVQVNGEGGDASLAEQSAWLSPGNYVLKYRMRSDRVEARRAASWNVYCAATMQKLVEDGRGALSGSGWNAESLTFAVPATCNGVRIQLVAHPRPGVPAAQIWYDDVKVERAD